MRAWRLARAEHARVLDGRGNRRRGARWNSAGRGVVYASEHASLAVVELLVHVDVAEIPSALSMIEIAVPNNRGVADLSLRDYPPDWRADAEWFRERGDRWLAEGWALVLRAPSVVVPWDLNVMLNPAHPGMAEVRVVGEEPFSFDRRLIA